MRTPFVARIVCSLSALAVLSLTACSTTRSPELTRVRRELEVRNREIERLNAELSQRAASVPAPVPASTEAPAASTASAETDALLPPNAQPGECYARVMIPATYETVSEQVLVKDASEQFEVIPAQYEWVEEQVLVKDASEQLEVVPAEYEVIEEQVMVTPATTRVEEVPAVYDWVEEQVLVQPAHSVWKKGTGPMQKVDNATGEIMCLVEVPAQYETVRKRVLVQAASTQTVEVPAEYRTVQRTVMKAPPSTRTITIPAEYATMKVQKLVRAEERRAVPVPAEYRTITKQVMVSEGGIGWQRVLCETNLSKDVVKALQEALAAQGFDPGPADGVLGPRTQAALQKYQTANQLAVGGITLEALERLGVRVSL